MGPLVGVLEWRLGQAVDERGDAIGDLLGLFERNQVAAVADYLQRGSGDPGDDVLGEQADGFDGVVIRAENEHGHVDPGKRGGDVLGDHRVRPCLPRLGSAGHTVADDLLPKLGAEPLVRPHDLEPLEHTVAGEICAQELLAELVGYRRGGRRGRRCDQHHSAESGGAISGDDLRDLAAHAVADEEVVVELERGDHRPRIIGEISDRIVAGGRLGSAPPSLVDRYAAVCRCEPVHHRSPSPRRTAPVVQKHQRRRAGSLLLDVQGDRLGRDACHLHVVNGHQISSELDRRANPVGECVVGVGCAHQATPLAPLGCSARSSRSARAIA